MSSIALPNTKTIIKNILPTGKHIRTLGPVFTYPKKHTRPRRLDFGLYHGKTVLFGNQISFSERKTRRKWQPNVHVVRLYSEAFDQRLRLKATAHALKCIEKKGGLDRYLLETSKEKIDSRFGLWLRKQVIKQMHKNKLQELEKEKLEWHAQRLMEEMENNPELRDTVLQEQAPEELIKDYENLPKEEKDLCERFEELELEEKRRREFDQKRVIKMTTKKPRLSKKEKYAAGNPYHYYAFEFQSNPETVKKTEEVYQKRLEKLERLKNKENVHPIQLDIY